MAVEPRVVSWPDWSHTQLTPAHARIYHSGARKLLINAGRGFGKDHLSFQRATGLMFRLYAERTADPSWRRLGNKVTVAVIGPTAANFTDLWDRFRDVMPQIPGVARDGCANVHALEDEGIVRVFGRGQIKISFVSGWGKGSALRGPGFDIILVTEAAYMEEMALTNSVLPTCLGRAGYAGYAVLNSSPRGSWSWWDRAVEQARRGDGYWGGWEVHEGCFADNPRITQADIDDHLALKAGNIYKYRQESLGWINVDCPPDSLMDSTQDRAFSPEEIDGIVERAERAGTREPAHKPPYYIGVDLAGCGPDPLCAVVVDGTGLVCHMEVHTSTTMEQVVAIIERLNTTWRPLQLSYDAHGELGKRLQGRLARVRANAVVYNRGKADYVKHLRQHIVHRTLRIPDPNDHVWGVKGMSQHVHRLLRELRMFRRYSLQTQRQRQGRIELAEYQTYGKPVGGTDDAIDALILALCGRPVPATDCQSPHTERAVVRLLTHR